MSVPKAALARAIWCRISSLIRILVERCIHRYGKLGTVSSIAFLAVILGSGRCTPGTCWKRILVLPVLCNTHPAACFCQYVNDELELLSRHSLAHHLHTEILQQKGLWFFTWLWNSWYWISSHLSCRWCVCLCGVWSLSDGALLQGRWRRWLVRSLSLAFLRYSSRFALWFHYWRERQPSYRHAGGRGS